MREQNNCLLAFIPRNEEKKNPMAESKLMLVVTLVSVVFVQVHSGNVPDNYGVRSGCEGTLYKDLCVSTMSTFPGSLQAGSRVDFCRFAMKLSVLEAQKAFSLISRFGRRGLNGMQSGALYDCMELFGLTLDALNESLSNVTNSKTNYFKWRQAADVQTWLSASLTNQATCLDGLQESTGSLSKYVFTNNIRNVSRLVSNTLAMVKNVSVVGNNSTDLKKLSVHNRRLLSDLSDVRQLHVKDEFFSHYGSMKDGFPSWLSAADRRLLQTSDDYSIEAEDFVTVAQDGSGNYTTITDAINAAPNKSDDRHVIYVTEGVYQENIAVPKYKTNIMLIGDGINATVITGNRSVVDGWTTFRSATFAVVGQGFLARDITFENTAGPEKHQAVALRVGSDLSAFYRCSMRGYQDTLYAHSLRQFYRECDIYGTVDFIFGNAAVVFQTCNILPRRPMANQKIALTAQGREDPNQNTGTSVQNCTVTAAPDLIPVQSSFQIFLGRPWKEYSRTVYLQSYLDNLIDPAGWLEWSGDFALSTLYYGEYMNSGPGAGTASRVTWPGYHVMNISDANNFTVAELIAGDSWLRSSAVPFDAVLN